MKDKKNYSISFLSFVSIIFLTVYALANSEQVYYQMGYAAITYLIIAAIFFFIPYSFIIAEMSSAFKNEKGGIFSWMSNSVNEGFAFIGTFIWYGSFVVMWFSASTICISISVVLTGKDLTNTWSMFGLSSPKTLAIVGIVYMLIVALTSTRGLKKMTFLSNISMVTVILTNVLILVGGLIVFALSGFKPAQGFDFSNVHSYFFGPNPSYNSILPAVGFLVFTIFSFSGMENSGGLVDKVRNAKKNVPKAIILSTIIITALYIGTVLILGLICNWQKTFGASNANLANFSIYIIQEEFYRFGSLIGLSPDTSMQIGLWVNRFITLLTLIGLTSVPIRIYSPIKHMFEGLPKGMLPEKLTKLNKHGVPQNAIFMQTIVVIIFIVLLGFGGGSVSSIFNKMTLMTFVSGTVPISFIIFAYIKFKKNDKIEKDYSFFSKRKGILFGSVCFIVVTFTNIYSIIEPALEGDFTSTIWIGIGPLLFGVIALILFIRYKKKLKKA